TQLAYAIGQLNGENSVGWYERLELSAINAVPSATKGRQDVTYHAKLPVAWGGSSQPDSYSLLLPSAVSEDDQLRFAAKYGTSCVDPTAGEVTVSRMFITYRPRTFGCALDPSDVVTLPARVSRSNVNTHGKYPEYQRIWDDRALNIIAMFSRQEDTTA